MQVENLILAHYTLVIVEDSDDVNRVFRSDVNRRSGDVNKVGAQRRWDGNHA
jgi:hypothetical protein